MLASTIQKKNGLVEIHSHRNRCSLNLIMIFVNLFSLFSFWKKRGHCILYYWTPCVSVIAYKSACVIYEVSSVLHKHVAGYCVRTLSLH